MAKTKGAQTVKAIYTQRSETGVLEGHFATREEALDWLKTEINIKNNTKKLTSKALATMEVSFFSIPSGPF